VSIVIYADRPAQAAELVGFAHTAGRQATVVAFEDGFADCGADRVLLLQGSPLVENNVPGLAQLLDAEGAELFMASDTVRGRDLTARVGTLLGWPVLSGASALTFADGAWRAERMMYGGAVVQSLTLGPRAVLTLAAGLHPPAEGTAPVETRRVAHDDRVSLVEKAPIPTQSTGLAQAERVVCVGMGVRQETDLAPVAQLAAGLGAELACTRGVAEERKWFPVERYIGISGANVKPQLYLSLGVSGQIQHVYGMRDSKVVACVNTDDRAPMFTAADYGIVGDLYEIVPLLIESLTT
jgi:electron transfer flavoprotein alpha subunit